jgi:hypothetical protein
VVVRLAADLAGFSGFPELLGGVKGARVVGALVLLVLHDQFDGSHRQLDLQEAFAPR